MFWVVVVIIAILVGMFVLKFFLPLVLGAIVIGIIAAVMWIYDLGCEDERAKIEIERMRLESNRKSDQLREQKRLQLEKEIEEIRQRARDKERK